MVNPRQRRAVVLIDAIVGSVLLGVSLVALITLTTGAISSQVEGERLQAAAMLLDEQLNLVLARGPDDYAQRFGLEGECDPPFESYRYRLEFSGGEGGVPYLVRATIAWKDAVRERSASVETMIAPRRGEVPDPIRSPQQPVERNAE